MSQAADHKTSLIILIKKHSATPLPVIETFYEIVTNQYWEAEDIIGFFEAGKGISAASDKIIDEFIVKERSLV